MTWEAVTPDIKVKRVAGVVQASRAEWNPLQGRQGQVDIPMTKQGEPIEIVLESEGGIIRGGIILRDMLEEGQEAIVPVMRPEDENLFLFGDGTQENPGIERQAKGQILEDGESLLLWPFMVKHFVSWRDEKAAEINQRTPDAKLKPSSRGGIEVQFNEAEGNEVSFTDKWTLPAGQTIQFVRLAPGKRVNLNHKPGEQVYVSVIKGELSNINRGVFTQPGAARSTLVTDDVAVAGPQGAIIQIVTGPSQAAGVTSMDQLQFKGELADKLLAWKKEEGAANVDVWNTPGFQIMDGGKEAAYVRFWKAGSGVNAGDYQRRGNAEKPVVEKYLVLSGLGGRTAVDNVSVNPGEEQGTARHPLRGFQATDQTVFWQTTEVAVDRAMGRHALQTTPDKFGGIDLTGNYNLRVQREAGAGPIDVSSGFLQGIDVKGLFPVLINDEPVDIPKLLEIQGAATTP